MQAVTLYELNARIKGFLKRGFPEAVWINYRNSVESLRTLLFAIGRQTGRG